MRAAEHAPRGPFQVLERLNALTEIVECGAGVLSAAHASRTDEATTIDDVKYWLAESVPRVTEPSDSPETTRPSTAFDDDRYLSREAKRKRASAKSSVGVCATPASLINEHASRHRRDTGTR